MKIKLVVTSLALMLATVVIAQEGPIHYTKLQEKFPSEINGFKPQGDKEGSTLDMSGMHFSTAGWIYTKGSAQIELLFFDYKGSDMIYQQSFSMYSEDLHFESDDELIEGIKIQDYPAIVAYDKQEKICTVTIGLYNRYLITINAEGLTKEMAIDFAKELPFSSFDK